MDGPPAAVGDEPDEARRGQSGGNGLATGGENGRAGPSLYAHSYPDFLPFRAAECKGVGRWRRTTKIPW